MLHEIPHGEPAVPFELRFRRQRGPDLERPERLRDRDAEPAQRLLPGTGRRPRRLRGGGGLASSNSSTGTQGHSYGGVIALLAAARTPERLRSLTVIEPPAFEVARIRPPTSSSLGSTGRTAARPRRVPAPGSPPSSVCRSRPGTSRGAPGRAHRRRGMAAVRGGSAGSHARHFRSSSGHSEALANGSAPSGPS